MSEQPVAGWYDDPEDPSQYRYWDGSTWTENRSPKQVPPPPGPSATESPRSASETVSASFSLMSAAVWPLVGLAAITAVGLFVALVPFVAGFFFLLEEERRAFGSSELNWTGDPTGIVLWVIAAVVYIAVILVMFPAFQARIEHARTQTLVTVGACLRYGFRKASRTLGRGLLVGLAYMLCFILPVIAIVLAMETISAAFGWLFILVAAWWIYGLPIVTIAGAGIAVAPSGESVLTTAYRAGRADWNLTAGAFYLAYLVLFALAMANGILGLIPLLGLITSMVLGFIQYTFFLGVMHYQWLRVGGRIDPDITALASDWRSEGNTE